MGLECNAIWSLASQHQKREYGLLRWGYGLLGSIARVNNPNKEWLFAVAVGLAPAHSTRTSLACHCPCPTCWFLSYYCTCARMPCCRPGLQIGELGAVKFYLAPKIDDEDQMGEDEAQS